MRLQTTFASVGGMCLAGHFYYYNSGLCEAARCRILSDTSHIGFIAYSNPFRYAEGTWRTGIRPLHGSDPLNVLSEPTTSCKTVTCKEFVEQFCRAKDVTDESENTVAEYTGSDSHIRAQPVIEGDADGHSKHLYKVVAWVKKIIENRDKTAAYLEVVDGTTSVHVPLVIRDTHPNYRDLQNADVGDAITVVATPEAKQTGQADRLTPMRLVVESEALGHVFTVHHSSRNRDEISPVALNGVYPMTYLREHCNLRVRNHIVQATFRIRSKVTERLFNIMADMGFVHVTTPSLTNMNCEGMGEIFKVGKAVFEYMAPQAIPPKTDDDQQVDSTYLSVSGQLELESLCSGISRVWKLGPAFRADRSDTPRHLSEFWMLEAEMNGVTLAELIDVIHTILVRAANVILSECQDDLAVIGAHGDGNAAERLKMLAGNSNRIESVTYSDAVGMLNEHKDSLCEYSHVNWGEPLTAAHERSLLKLTKQSLLAVTQFPASVTPFYMERLSDGTVNNVDIFADGVGEIAGGSIREVRYDMLTSAMKEHGISGVDYDRYLELRKFGNVTHGGFGIGFERILMYLLDIPNIRDVIHFPKLRKKYTVE
ncbi:Asparagine--tRNA ligase [Babesia sp. Xinjiang]|uniref:Asparagine--tRNA ligase n=1 Tax=Babesia sp. Xinjiang TaxID=462227 RepID=UPI000A22EA24|nr:Asparagine--tRNA ligase [Babesia sp. Xinjiang]ORM39592.1 Asparagine--tRNA ligase [Babesia sp. Xinjiang]